MGVCVCVCGCVCFVLFCFVLFCFVLFCFVLFCVFFFFFFAFYFSKPLKFVLGLPKWKFSTGKKHFTPGKKSEKMTLPPQKNLPVTPLYEISHIYFCDILYTSNTIFCVLIGLPGTSWPLSSVVFHGLSVLCILRFFLYQKFNFFEFLFENTGRFHKHQGPAM